MQRKQIYHKFKQFRKRLTGKERHASNSGYNVQKRVHELLLAGEKLTGKALLKTDNKQQEELLETVCTLANNREAGKFAEPADIAKMREFIADNMQYMTTEFLDRIEQIAMMSGLLALAHAVRENNEELVLQLAKQSELPAMKRNITKLFWAYVNRGDDEAAKKLLSHPGMHGFADGKADSKAEMEQHVRGLCAALGMGGKESGVNERKPEHVAFAEFIRNKSIAVLGPSTEGTDYGDEIKRDFDIIIRTSYRGHEYLPEMQREIVPHISYYGDIDWESFLGRNDENLRHLSGLMFVVLSRGECQSQLRDFGLKNVRVATHMRDDFLFLGKHNMIQTILHDLSGFEPARVKVFYANLFLSDTLYDEEYAKPGTGVKMQGSREDNLMFRRIMVKHNIISQYDYTRQLYKRGLIDADTRLAEILEMGTAEFVSKLETQENRKELGIRN